MAAWLDALAAAERENQAAVLVTVLAAKGSTPREAGAKMVVSADGMAGTIGGGNLEYQCEAAARALLVAGAEGPSTRDFPLGPALGQCCGGHVTVLFEVLRPPRLHVGLFGAGHVGKALVKLLADLPCRVSWVDARPEALPANLPPNVVPVRVALPVQAVGGLPAGSLVLVMTADKLICPIGLPGIAGKEPAVVAVSVAAQILQLQPQPLQRSAGPMPIGERSCGDCVCPPVVATEARR
jgi:xanthine dehydrogenase accessory factor